MKEHFSTVSRPPAALPSSPSADFVISYPGKLRFSGVKNMQKAAIPKSEEANTCHIKAQYIVVGYFMTTICKGDF